MKLKIVFTQLAAAISVAVSAGTAGYAGFRTGQPLPVPNRMEFTGEAVGLSGEVAVRWDGAAPTTAADAAATKLVGEIVGEIPENPEGAKLEIVLRLSPELPPQGYTLESVVSDRLFSVGLAGGSLRGLYYGAATLAQLVSLSADGAAKLAPVKIADAPVWEHRYVSDVFANATDDHFIELAAKKLGGICLRAEGDWQSDEWFASNSGQLAAIKRAHELDLADVMIQMHLYPAWSGRPLNLAHEEDIDLVIAAIRRFAKAGADMIMVAVDDSTPRDADQKTYTLPTEEEKSLFDRSAGKAHGMLMRRLSEALAHDYPDLILSMVVAPYATETHGLRYPEVRRYFTDWAKEAPPEAALVWTGRKVFSPETTPEHADEVKSLLKGNPLIMFSNSNGIAAPMPLWRTTFYPEMLEDSRGIILLWGSYFLRPLERVYYLGANAYLWNPDSYDADRDYKRAAAILYGSAAAAPFLELQKSYQAAMAHRSTGNRKGLTEAVARLDKAFRRAAEIKTPAGDPLPLEQLAGYVAHERGVLDFQPPILVVQKNGKAAVNLRPRNRNSDPEPVKVTVSFDDSSLRLHFDVTNPDLADQAEQPRDYPVYTNPDEVELFIQPAPACDEWINSEPPDNGYAQFCFDSAGNRFDSIAANPGYSFDPEWQVTAARTEGGWEADVVIPYSAFENNDGLRFVKPAPGVIWRVNFHRVNNAKKLVSSFAVQGEGFHAPEWFGELHFSAAPADVVCEGSYPYHLQGVDMNEKGEYFWSFSDRIVKTDHNGKVVKAVETGLHVGDLCCRDGKVYTSFSVIHDYSLGAEWGSIKVYDQEDLSFLSERRIVDKLGCDGIAATPYGFEVAVLLRPSVDQTTSLIFSYDLDFNLLDTHAVNHGPVYSGIQSFKRLPEGGYIAAPYGGETLILDDALNIVKRYKFSMPDGVVPSGAGTGVSAAYSNQERGKYQAYLSAYDLDGETEK